MKRFYNRSSLLSLAIAIMGIGLAVFLTSNLDTAFTRSASAAFRGLALRVGDRGFVACEGQLTTQWVNNSRSFIRLDCLARGGSPAPNPMPPAPATPRPETPRPSMMPMPSSMPFTPRPSMTPAPGTGGSLEGGLGVGSGDGKEIGIKLAAFNQLKADAANGIYNRACTNAEHDPTKWHTLVNPTAKCHYDHHHGDDPNYVNDIFGQPGNWFGNSGQSVSYPWQTFVIPEGQGRTYVNTNPSELENGYKHEGYQWLVRRNQDCPQGDCVTDFRLQYHAHAGMDFPVRHHSTSIEMRVCLDKNNASTCGIYRNGGWIDMGRLFTTDNNVSCLHAVNEVFIPVPGETRFGSFDRPEARDEIRCHPTINSLSGFPSQSKAMAEWWGHFSGAGNEIRYQIRFHDPVGNVNRSNPTASTSTFCNPTSPSCNFTQSLNSVFVGYTTHLRIANANGTTVRYINRWGGTASGCTRASTDCIPMTVERVRMNLDFNNDGTPEEARYGHTVCDNCTRVNHNISPSGQQWITWIYRH